ncbi:MAG: hypothetical protein COA82_07915 [Alkaliphilus sp.]|nr:NUDIX domain-containing protein [Alkaliphilus sp. AH-315-G20]PHS33907.1 MAG: hypothetical protein COA82_07915 [Alkaliphilus sp.]
MNRKNVQVYIFDEKAKSLLMLKRTVSKSGYWQPICGGIEVDELEVEAAVREVEEETGYGIVQSIEKLPFKFSYSEPKNGVLIDMEDICFLVKVESKFDVKLSREHETYKWCELNRVSELTDWKPIQDVCLYLEERFK